MSQADSTSIAKNFTKTVTLPIERPPSSTGGIFTRDAHDSSVIVADGYGISISVNRGHLIVEDGIGKTRRLRRIPRAQRTVNRILILGQTGHITFEAVRWCHELGISIVQLDANGTTLLTA